MNATAEFEEITAEIVRRFFRQNAEAPPADAEIGRVAARLSAVVAERGWPRPLAAGETGSPGGLPEAEVAALAARVAGEGAGARLAEAAKQLVKACFYPEFTVCRDSYRETAKDGTCKRQEWARVRGRVSGSHCVDCPYWTALEPAAHAALLRTAWCGAAEEFERERGGFLPEDFRALRAWRHAAARR